MKRLFFTAFVAVVAVGGAYAQQYSTGPGGTGSRVNCSGQIDPLCSGLSGGAYIYPTSTWVSSLPDETIREVYP